MADDPIELLTSGEVAETLGVGPSTVKRWTDSGELTCVKTLGGHRRFARSEVHAFARRNGIAAAPQPTNVLPLSRRISARDSVQVAATAAAPGLEQRSADTINRWLTLLAGDRGAYEVQAALLGERVSRTCWWRVAELMGEVLDAAGQRWADGRMSVVQEHLVSERLQRGLAMVSESLPVRDDAPRCLLVTAENDDHTLGLSLLELCLREAGWMPRWCGRKTPTEEVIRFVGTRSVEMVAVSATSTDAGELARQAEALGVACRVHEVELLLGGSGAWPQKPSHGFRVRGFPELRVILERSGR